MVVVILVVVVTLVVVHLVYNTEVTRYNPIKPFHPLD